MKKGDKVEVRNIDSEDWTLATYIRTMQDGFLLVTIDDPDHPLRLDDDEGQPRPMCVSPDHWREVEQKNT